MKNVIVERVIHNGAKRIALKFLYDTELIALVKELPDARWSGTKRYWHISDKPDIVQELFRLLKGKAFLDYSSLKPEKREEPHPEVKVSAALGELSPGDIAKIEEFRKWMIHRRYSDSTIDIYAGMLGQFFRFIKPKKSSEINSDDMVRYVTEYIIPSGLSYTFQNQTISAAKLFFNHIYKMDLDVETFKRPRREHRLPNVLSKEEIKSILQAPSNLKHRPMLSIIYACGLR
jgi:integrase/recombinase XerD